MPKTFRPMSIAEFHSEVTAFAWQRRIWRVDMHHTLHPDHARWREIGSAACVDGMCRSHTRDRGFDGIAQHISVMPDGEIWTGRNWNRTPASVGFGMNRGVFMLEVVGNFDLGCDRLEGTQLDVTVSVIRAVQSRFRLPPEALLFHREVPQTEKTCPGTSVEKQEILSLVRQSRIKGPLPPLSLMDLALLPLEIRG